MASTQIVQAQPVAEFVDLPDTAFPCPVSAGCVLSLVFQALIKERFDYCYLVRGLIDILN